MPELVRTSDGVALNVVDTGPRDAPVTVVLSHGWTSALGVWDHVVAALGPTVRTVRYDHRGHGGSGSAAEATLELLADDMAEVIAAKAPSGSIVLVGHSMGGMAMMALAERHPALVRRVVSAVFVSTSSGRMGEVTFGLPKPIARIALRRTGGGGGSGSGSGGRPRKRRKIHVPPAVRRAVALAAVRWVAFGTRFRMIDVRATADHAAAIHRRTAAVLRRDIVKKHDRAAALAGYADADVQVLVGDRDKITPVDHAKAIAAALPHAEFVLYPTAGHMLPFERVREIATRIARGVDHAANPNRLTRGA